MLDLEGTDLRELDDDTFEVLASRPISWNQIEIVYEGDDDTVPYELDVRGSVLSAFSFEISSTFATGRNSYVVEFAALGRGDGPALFDVAFIPSLNTLRLPDSNLTFTENRVDVSVSGVRFNEGAGWAVQLGFDIPGTGRGDVLFGDDGNDRVSGKGGDDVIRGGFGEDILLGGKGKDQIDGGGQDDVIRGGGGSDTINGGKGDDMLFGQGGADTFVIDAGSDKNTIRDFDLEEDSLVIRTGADELSDMNITIKRKAIILRDEGATVLLNGLDLADLAEADITFA